MRIFVVPLVLSLLACSNLGSIHGRVVNRLNDQPVEGVTVLLAGTTATATTGKDGTYTLNEVAPGPQRVVLHESNLLVLDELSLTVGERQKLEATDLVVVPNVESNGLFGYDPAQNHLTRLTGKPVNPCLRQRGSLEQGALDGLPAATSPVHFVLSGGYDPSPMLTVWRPVQAAAERKPNRNAAVGTMIEHPAHWELEQVLEAAMTSIVLPGSMSQLAQGRVELPPGTYCVSNIRGPQILYGQCDPFTVVGKQERAWVESTPVAEGE